MVNVDHGIMPAATTELKEDLELNEIQLGILGSLVYLGLVLGKPSPLFTFPTGSLFAMPLFNYCNTKFIIIVCLFSNCAGLILFTVSTNFYILALSRGAVGFFQVQ